MWFNRNITGNMEITSSIILTESAASHISEMLVDDTTNTGKSLRVYVEGGGCSGLSYKLDFDNESQEGDQEFESNGYKVVCDMKSFLYLCGTELDFTDGLNGKGFQFNNPNASRTCGCGESFSL